VITAWALVRFTHVIFAMAWVGGQLTLSLLLIPLLQRKLSPELAASVRTSFGKTFGIYTLALFLPLQVATGIALAMHAGVTWASLLQPGYGRTLLAKLVVFALVLAISGVHGYLQGTGRKQAARSLALASLIGSVVIVLLAVALASH
jgi:putative copper export protein